ncbi:MAG: FAD-dependent oxidoreductase [Candidatus Aminicenantes bacterium]|nr:FAD-dependent oxidoreductase [Candidatus Aminicenantes bacterium]
MSGIHRNIAAAAAEKFDLIIVGGGIYGVMLALEAGQRQKKALLLEKDDFGAATSLNHLRTIHGGLRYLQSLDLPRFFESVHERRWFLANFPALVQVLPCLMPLYGRGLKRPSIMAPALMLNDILAATRNHGVSNRNRLARGRLVSSDFTIKAFPQVDRKGLQASAMWYDGFAPEHQRLFMESLRWACSLGAVALNYVQAESLLLQQNQVRGLRAKDNRSGQHIEFHAPVVINAAGPWSRQLAQNFDRDYTRLFPKRLLLFNILFKRNAISEYALALAPRDRQDHTYFIHNWKNRLLAGTAEILVTGQPDHPRPEAEQIAEFIFDMNQMVPDLTLNENDIEHIYAGILPATKTGTLARREVIIRHRDHGGAQGLFSVSGVKFTTSRLVAEKTLSRIFPGLPAKKPQAPPAEANSGRWLFDYQWLPTATDNETIVSLKHLVEDEAVVHLDDLLFRRTSLGENRRRSLELLPWLRPLFSWNDLRWQQETDRLKNLPNTLPH